MVRICGVLPPLARRARQGINFFPTPRQLPVRTTPGSAAKNSGGIGSKGRAGSDQGLAYIRLMWICRLMWIW